MNVLKRLEEWKRKEFITSAEVEFVRFLQQINPDENEGMLLAAAACVHAQSNGHVCLDIGKLENEYLFDEPETEIKVSDGLKKQWILALQNSDLVSSGDELQPLVLEEERLYLHRFWKYEEELSGWLKVKSAHMHEVSEEIKNSLQLLLTPSGDLFEINWQHLAVVLSFLKDLVIISGGPGTGKTYTVLNIIAAQKLARSGETFRIALAAPTGKAARRLIDSIEDGKENLPDQVRSQLEIPEEALTVHKLLGADFRGSSFKFNEQNKLPYDMVVVDEASMLDLTMWVRLVRAIGEDTKLVVLGDKDQLASVEAGSILGDICGGENSFSGKIAKEISILTGFNVPEVQQSSIPSINDCIVFLTKSYRFTENSGIKNLSEAINRSDFERVWEILNSDDYLDIQVAEPNSDTMAQLIKEYAIRHHKHVVGGDDQRLSVSNEKKILCAVRKSDFGTERINLNSEQRIKRNTGILVSDEWYDGRPVMATKNNAMLRIKNGELGIYNKNNGLVHFEGEDKIQVSTTRLTDYEPAFAITIHKSQGSEFNKVAIVLPTKEKSILSKEILYTAVTRARQNTLVIASKEILMKTVTRSVSRNSGVRQKIWG